MVKKLTSKDGIFMKTNKVLDMLNEGRIEELKALLQDEIYADSLKSKPTAKKRYAAMKRYLKHTSQSREILQKPCEVEVHGEKYFSFCNAYSLALTTETVGEIALCDDPSRYPKVESLVRFDGDYNSVDLNTVLAEAKSKGYKFKNSAMFNNDYLMHYDGAYFRIGLIDITYGVIADENLPTIYHVKGERRKSITIKNDIGIAVIMPVFIDELDNSIVIEAERP